VVLLIWILAIYLLGLLIWSLILVNKGLQEYSKGKAEPQRGTPARSWQLSPPCPLGDPGSAYVSGPLLRVNCKASPQPLPSEGLCAVCGRI
jgi:hypothetical protein